MKQAAEQDYENENDICFRFIIKESSWNINIESINLYVD